MDKDNLEKLNRKELIEVIESYKKKLASTEEYMNVMNVGSNQNF